MIRTELICSRDYARRVNALLTEEGWENLICASKKFKPVYSKNMPVILDKIPNYTGFTWKRDLFIPIYLVDYSGPSRTNPLTIKVDSNENMLVKLIHEMSHVNFLNKFGLNEDVYEDVINQITENLSESLGVRSCEALEKIIYYRRKLIKKGVPLKKIPFRSTNLKNYFSV